MKVFNELLLVSKESILSKIFDIDQEKFEKLPDSEKEEAKKLFPTESEKNFMTVFRSTSPQLARLQRKMSVCLDVEVIEYDFNKITFTYAGNTYKLLSPKNAYRICQALETDSFTALKEMGKQGCIFINEKQILDVTQDNALEVDELRIIEKVVDKFFFQTFIV